MAIPDDYLIRYFTVVPIPMNGRAFNVSGYIRNHIGGWCKGEVPWADNDNKPEPPKLIG